MNHGGWIMVDGSWWMDHGGWIMKSPVYQPVTLPLMLPDGTVMMPNKIVTSPTHHSMVSPVSNHTKGPWYVLRDKIDDSVDVVSNDAVIAEMYRRGDIETELSNAHRIVACVNACVGFAVCELEGAELYKDSIKAQVEISALKKQRGELVAALKKLNHAVTENFDEIGVNVSEAIYNAHLLIVKTEDES